MPSWTRHNTTASHLLRSDGPSHFGFGVRSVAEGPQTSESAREGVPQHKHRVLVSATHSVRHQATDRANTPHLSSSPMKAHLRRLAMAAESTTASEVCAVSMSPVGARPLKNRVIRLLDPTCE